MSGDVGAEGRPPNVLPTQDDVGAEVAAVLAAEICPRASGPCSSCVSAADCFLASDWFAARVEAAKAETWDECTDAHHEYAVRQGLAFAHPPNPHRALDPEDPS